MLFRFLYGATFSKLRFCNLFTVVRYVLGIFVVVFIAESSYMMIAN